MSQEMSAVLGYLYIGGKSDAKDKDKLLKIGIKYILNCTPPRTLDRENGCPNYYEKEKTFIYKRIPIFDNKGEDILSHLDSAYNFIEEGRHYGKVLVHCHKGVSRSVSFVIGYLMRKNEFTFDEALAHVQSCRPIVQPNTSFIQQLKTYRPTVTTVEDDKKTSGEQPGPQLGPPRVSPIIATDNVTADADADKRTRFTNCPETFSAGASPKSKDFLEHRKSHYRDEAHPPPLVHYAEAAQVLAAHDVSSPHSMQFLELRKSDAHEEAHPGQLVHYAEPPQILAAHDITAESKEFLKQRQTKVQDEAHPGHLVHYAEPPQTLAAHDITAESREFLELRKKHYRQEAHVPVVKYAEPPQILEAHDARAPHSPGFLELRKQHYNKEADIPSLVHYAEPPQILEAHDARAPHSPGFLEMRKQHYRDEAHVQSPSATAKVEEVDSSVIKKARIV